MGCRLVSRQDLAMLFWFLFACAGFDSPGTDSDLPRDEICQDGRDNDQDGQTDCLDPDCSDLESCDEDCSDGLDNDQDELVDCQDPECEGQEPCLEVCDDGLDNDEDGWLDCLDPECRDHKSCREDCYDQLDNDQDGLVDCHDPECEDLITCEEHCDNGEDDNRDGLVDCADPRCADERHCREICVGGVDEDFDGLVDCEDGDCVNDVACKEHCEGGLDEDNDGYVDCADDDCWMRAPCEPEKWVYLDAGSIQRENTSGFSRGKSGSWRYGGGNQRLYEVSGRVQYTSVLGQPKSCSFQIETWTASWHWDNSSGIRAGPLTLNGLNVAPDCSALYASGFLPDRRLFSLSSMGSYSRGLVSGDVLMIDRLSGLARVYPWFSGSILTWSSSDLVVDSSPYSGGAHFFGEKHYSGAIQSISPFHWTPMLSTPLE